MATLAEIRAQYPQYKDLSDQSLADGLYKKFYSDMPRAEFDKKVGLTNRVAQTFDTLAENPEDVNTADALHRGLSTPPERSMGGALAEGYGQDVAAAAQGTSPHVRTMSGKLNYRPLGDLVEMDFGPAYYDENSQLRAINPEQDVVLRDDATGKMMVFARSPETDERLAAIGRLVLPGIAANSPAGTVGRVVSAAAAPTRAQTIVRAFDQSGIEPSLAAVSQNRGVAGLAQGINQTIAGAPISGSMARQTEQAAVRADDIASTISDVGQPSVAGERLQAGAERFVNETAPARQENLYGAARGAIEGPWSQGVIAGKAAPVSSLPVTQKEVARLENMVGNPDVRAFVTDKNFKALAEVIDKAGEAGLSFDDLRELRTQVRKLRPAEGTKVGINKGAVDRVYNALTEDMHAMALEAGGPQALRAIQMADRYTRALEAVRKPAIMKVVEKPSGEGVFADVLRLAQDGSGGDWRRLAQIRRSVSPQEWNDVSATVIRTLGKKTAGALTSVDDADFSPSTFMTNFAKLSPRGKSIIFGGEANTQLRQALDSLVTATGELKRVESLGNPSGTGRIASANAALAGMVFAPVETLATLGAGYTAARIMTSPRLVRWLTGVTRATASGNKMMVRYQLQRLEKLTGGDKDIWLTLSGAVSGEEAERRGVSTATRSLRSEESPQLAIGTAAIQ